MQTAKAQFSLPVGARMNSMGNASVTLSDAFSLFANPACLTENSRANVGLYFDHKYNLAGLNTMAIAGSKKLGSSAMSAGISRLGDELLNHTRIEVGFAYKIRNVSLGGGLGYHQMYVSEHGTGKSMTLQFGGTAQLTPKLKFGAHAYNLSRSKIGKESSLYYPVWMRAGFSYLPIKQIICIAELEKDSRYAPNAKIGVEYNLKERLCFRTGINTLPSNGFAGLGVQVKEFRLDYGVSFHSRLGLTHFVGLVFEAKCQTKGPEYPGP